MPAAHLVPFVVRDCSHETKGIMRGKKDESKFAMPEALVASIQLRVVVHFL
jgi:hypothetical protein